VIRCRFGWVCVGFGHTNKTTYLLYFEMWDDVRREANMGREDCDGGIFVVQPPWLRMDVEK